MLIYNKRKVKIQNCISEHAGGFCLLALLTKLLLGMVLITEFQPHNLKAESDQWK